MQNDVDISDKNNRIYLDDVYIAVLTDIDNAAVEPFYEADDTYALNSCYVIQPLLKNDDDSYTELFPRNPVSPRSQVLSDETTFHIGHKVCDCIIPLNKILPNFSGQFHRTNNMLSIGNSLVVRDRYLSRINAAYSQKDNKGLIKKMNKN